MSDTTALAARQNGAGDLIEQVVIQGNLAGLTAPQRAGYYDKVCTSLGLNPYTRPFDYLTLNGKLVLYARKDATDQIRNLRGVSLAIVSREIVSDLYVVTARATLPNGRCDEEIGAVSIKGLAGEALANAMMKASTKAKRRVTLSIAGLGWLDESEVDSIPHAAVVPVDAQGEIAPQPALPAERTVQDVPASDEMVKEARALYAKAHRLGLAPPPPNKASTAATAQWLAHWGAEVVRATRERAQAAEAQAAVDAARARAEEKLGLTPTDTEADWKDLGSESEREQQPALMDAPRPPTYAGERTPTPISGAAGLATPSQVTAIYSIAKNERGMDAEQINAWCVEHYHAAPSALSKRDASAVIDALKAS